MALDPQQFIEDNNKALRETLSELKEKIKLVESYDLLSNLALYNHFYDGKEYKDYQEDRMFVISEIVALIALQGNYIKTTSIPPAGFSNHIEEIQNLAFKYRHFEGMRMMSERMVADRNTFEGIALKTMADESSIRNPTYPHHHFEVSIELYAQFEKEIVEKFGFGVRDSIALRKSILDLINKKFFEEKDKVDARVMALSMEVYKYRATQKIPESTDLTAEDFISLNKFSRKRIKEILFQNCLAGLFYNLSRALTFTVAELSDDSGVDLNKTEKFLSVFSCSFGSVLPSDVILSPETILKSKPLIHHENRYLCPSIPLLNFCVEPVIESFFKTNSKIQNRFKGVKHEFLLTKGIGLLTELLKSVKVFRNLYYTEESPDRYESDALVLYGRTLLIIEAKGHRISEPAKRGAVPRTEKHMDEIIGDSYNQAVRTLEYFKKHKNPHFFTKTKQRIEFERDVVDNYVLIVLTLEPLGNITHLLRTTASIGYFGEGKFPWIISIFDLIVIKDHLPVPSMLFHYIKRREKFLASNLTSVFEETDMLGYYLSNGLFIDHILEEAAEKSVDSVFFENQTDPINNYYVQKYVHRDTAAPKMQSYLPSVLIELIKAIEATTFKERDAVIAGVLDVTVQRQKLFSDYILRVKKMFSKDGGRHDCSVLKDDIGNKYGISFFTGRHPNEISGSMFQYAHYKMQQTGAGRWLTIGDVCENENTFEIKSLHIFKFR